MKRWVAVGCLAVALFQVGCRSAQSDLDEAPEVDGTRQAIRNGYVLNDDDYSGVVAIQVWSNTLGSYATFCSGVVMENDRVLTAAHCLEGEDRTVYAVMGSQRRRVTDQILHTVYDVAMTKLQFPFVMYNWSLDHYLTDTPQLGLSGYRRSVDPRDPEQYDGASLLCFGYGGSGYTPPLTYAVLSTTFGSDNSNPTDEIHMYENGLRQMHLPGDSGGPCVTAFATDTAPLATVNSGCTPSRHFCHGPPAAYWSLWAWYAMRSL